MADSAQHDHLLQVHRRLDAHDSRLKTLETQQAVAAERAETIKVALDEIRGDQRWLIKLVIAGIIAGVVAFMMKGGFHVG